jgi:hypothetical protein
MKMVLMILIAVLRLLNDFLFYFSELIMCGLCPEYFVHLYVPILVFNRIFFCTLCYSAFYFLWYSTGTFWYSEEILCASGILFPLHEVFLCWHILWLKRGRKMYIYTLYACMFAFILQLFVCVCYTTPIPVMPVFSVVAFILQLLQVVCKCCHGCYNILMFLMMI